MTQEKKEELKRIAFREIGVLKMKENEPTDGRYENAFDNLVNVMGQGFFKEEDLGLTSEQFGRFSDKRFGCRP